MTLSLYRFVVLGLGASFALTMFLFNLSWTEITAIGGDVSVVKEDVAYMKGLMQSYWELDSNP